jgi:hypothetical protein
MGEGIHLVFDPIAQCVVHKDQFFLSKDLEPVLLLKNRNERLRDSESELSLFLERPMKFS